MTKAKKVEATKATKRPNSSMGETRTREQGLAIRYRPELSMTPDSATKLVRLQPLS